MARRRGDDFENSEVFLEVQGALARKIKRLRLDRDLSQRQLASIADVSGPHFGLIEAGVGNVSLRKPSAFLLQIYSKARAAGKAAWTARSCVCPALWRRSK